jgi:hypothetical protein
MGTRAAGWSRLICRSGELIHRSATQTASGLRSRAVRATGGSFPRVTSAVLGSPHPFLSLQSLRLVSARQQCAGTVTDTSGGAIMKVSCP